MIEIIREESGKSEKQGLPKDIKQIGKPDIGDRIYVENQVYQSLHPHGSSEEKRAYVLLGRFENYAGRDCVFVEAAIWLREMEFDGELPLWSDQTWAYIYKQLKDEYDSLVIVGWALDIKGQLPNMTARLEKLHQSHFGGVHQILLRIDSLEREETFYGTRSGHLYRREGFYIYYKKGSSMQRGTDVTVWDDAFYRKEPYARQKAQEEPAEGTDRLEAAFYRDGDQEETSQRQGEETSRRQEKETSRRQEEASSADTADVYGTARDTVTEQSDKNDKTDFSDYQLKNDSDFDKKWTYETKLYSADNRENKMREPYSARESTPVDETDPGKRDPGKKIFRNSRKAAEAETEEGPASRNGRKAMKAEEEPASRNSRKAVKAETEEEPASRNSRKAVKAETEEEMASRNNRKTVKAETEEGMAEQEDGRTAGEREDRFADRDFIRRYFPGRETARRSMYRRQMAGREENQPVSSYASTFFLLMVVCLLGITAYLNNEKMAAMEETLSRISQAQAAEADKNKGTEDTEAPDVMIERVTGTVQRLENEGTANDENAGGIPDSSGQPADAAADSGAAGGAAAGNPGDTTGQDTAGTQDSQVTGAPDQPGADTPDQSGAEAPDQPASATPETDRQAADMSAATDTTGNGDVATQPDTSAQPDAAAAAMAEARTYLDQGYYVVQKGDSLVGICRKIYQTTAMMDKLCEVNGIEDENTIYAGQQLILPN